MSLLPHQLIAHRGCRAEFPENSLLAIEAAITAGAHNIEFDVQFTRDGHVALYHDADMQRISGITGTLFDYTKLQLADCFAYEPQRLGDKFIHNPINYLEDLLPIIRHHPHIRFYMEIKEESLNFFGHSFCFEHLGDLFNSMPDNCILISFDSQSLLQAREHYGVKQTALVFRDWLSRNQKLEVAGADFGFINYKRIPDDETICANVPIMVYETCDPFLTRQLLERGAAAVETFCIASLLSDATRVE